MITFEGNRQFLKPAKTLERKAQSIYPHISTSRIKTHLREDKPKPKFYIELAKKLSNVRRMIRESGEVYSSVIYALQDGRIGNCTEDALFAELLGKINGQKNIYCGGVFFNKGDDKLKLLDHAVAFITEKDISNGVKCDFKNKEAVIIDPWLGITDFAENYFTKIKTLFRKTFRNLPNNELAMRIIGLDTNNPKEFKQVKKELCPNTRFCIIPFTEDATLDKTKLDEIREFFPELIIKNFEPINLNNKV